MQQRVNHVYDVDELKQCLIDVWHRVDQKVIDDSVDERLICDFLLANNTNCAVSYRFQVMADY